MLAIVAAHGDRLDAGSRLDPAVRLLLAARRRGREPTPRELDRVGAVLARRALEHQRRGRAHWRPRIAELKAMRAAGELLPEGLPVRRLLDT